MNPFRRLAILWRLSDVPVALGATLVKTFSDSEREYKREISRLQMLSRLVSVADRAKEIEKEWQRIQQDEHDAFFAFQVFKGTSQADHAYKKGIADGIKWSINRFS